MLAHRKLKCFYEIPMEINPAQQTQWYDKNVVRSQLRTTNTQNCCDVDGTTMLSQSCIASSIYNIPLLIL